MGISERLMYNFEDTTIQYQDKKFYIVKQFEYNGKTYLYGVDINTLESEAFEYAFLYRIEDDIFNHVQDDALWDELFDVVSGLCAQEIVTEGARKHLKK